MPETIICGVDGSAASVVALDVAAGLAERQDARLLMVHAVQHAVGGNGAASAHARLITERETEAAELLLEHLAEAAGLEHAERRVVSGHPAERLAELADDEGAELIVVGSRGRSSFKAGLLGSTATSLIAIARCPVLVVPQSTRATTRRDSGAPRSAGR